MQILDEYPKAINAKVACELQANDQSKYGAPEWSWTPFSSTEKGDAATKSGVLKLFDADFKFQNGFGAMVKMMGSCDYDLAADRVLNVSVFEKP